MKVLVCGSRDWPIGRGDEVRDRIGELPEDAVVIEGEAVGPDVLARMAADDRGLFVVRVPVRGGHWRRYGRSAGHRRNAVMLDLAPDLVIAFHRGDSHGTQGTIDEARRRGIPVEVHSA